MEPSKTTRHDNNKKKKNTTVRDRRRLTCLPGGVLHEQRGDVLVHAHLVLGDARVGARILVPHTANMDLTAIGYGGREGEIARGRASGREGGMKRGGENRRGKWRREDEREGSCQERGK